MSSTATGKRPCARAVAWGPERGEGTACSAVYDGRSGAATGDEKHVSLGKPAQVHYIQPLENFVVDTPADSDPSLVEGEWNGATMPAALGLPCMLCTVPYAGALRAMVAEPGTSNLSPEVHSHY